MYAFLKSLVLPLLIVSYPILFLYSQNVDKINLDVLPFPLISALLVAGLAFGLFYLVQRNALTASLSAVAFVLFFYLYGFVYRQLVRWDRFPVQHFLLLPAMIVPAAYAGYFIARVRPSAAAAAQKILLVIATALIAYNLVIIAPVEVKKMSDLGAPMPVTAAPATTGQKYPDVYYIIFDEYVRFDAMREYWHNYEVDDFEAFLKENGFFYASKSLSPTINTTTEMSSRLNLHQYYEKDDKGQVLHNLIKNNKLMQIFKAHGYTTVSINMHHPDMVADVKFKFDTNEVGGLASGEFRQTFLDDTMFAAFSGIINDGDAVALKKRELVLFAAEKTTSLDNIKSPKFVYTHFLTPHMPFVFDEYGDLLPPQAAEDWHYYLGQYKYTTKLAMQLIAELLANADPNNPPVIILQSDHGARNLVRRTPDKIIITGYLEKYPRRYSQYIMNALYLPGYDTSKLPADLPAMEALVIVLNHYLDAGVSIEKTP